MGKNAFFDFVSNLNTYHFNLLGPNLHLCYSNRFLHLLTVYSTLEESSILLYHKRQIPHYNWTNRIRSLLSNLVQLGWLFVITNPMVSDWGCFSHFSLGMIELSNLFGHIYSTESLKWVASCRDWIQCFHTPIIFHRVFSSAHSYKCVHSHNYN